MIGRRDRVSCPLCEWSGPEFGPAGRNGRPNASCPGCGSLERHRAAYLYLRDETTLLEAGSRVLHFAPEPSLRKVLEGRPGLEYVSTDLEMPGVSLHMDIRDLLFRDGVFDLVVCSHVLEHVPDDAAALREIARVLRPGGMALVMVPLLSRTGVTVEDPAIVDPAERERVYGQVDHVRAYGPDIAGRIAATGLAVEVVGYPQRLGEEAIQRHALTRSEQLFVCRAAG